MMDIEQLKIDVKDGIEYATQHGFGITHHQWISLSIPPMVCPITAAYFKAKGQFPKSASDVVVWAKRRYGEVETEHGTIPVFVQFAGLYDDYIDQGHDFRDAVKLAVHYLEEMGS
jgi:hypothetical protein